MRLLFVFSCLVLLVSGKSGFIAAQDIDQLRKAAESGDVEAQWNLGVAYANGDGIEENDEEALKWFLLAAELGYAEAQDTLGFLYSSGHGVPQDFEEALKWYQLAADQDSPRLSST